MAPRPQTDTTNLYQVPTTNYFLQPKDEFGGNLYFAEIHNRWLEIDNRWPAGTVERVYRKYLWSHAANIIAELQNEGAENMLTAPKPDTEGQKLASGKKTAGGLKRTDAIKRPEVNSGVGGVAGKVELKRKGAVKGAPRALMETRAASAAQYGGVRKSDRLGQQTRH